jgi:hypothetical protein
MYGPSTTLGGFAFTGGMVFMVLFFPFILVCEYGAMIGSSFAGEYQLTSLTYWTWIVTVTFPVLSFCMMTLAIGLGRAAVSTGALILYGIALAWQLYAIIYGVLMFADCEGDIHCAANLSYIGAVIGPYAGPSVRFLFIFSATIAMALVEIIACGVLFAARRLMIAARNSEASYLGAALARKKYSQRVKAGNIAAMVDYHLAEQSVQRHRQDTLTDTSVLGDYGSEEEES